MSHFFARVKQHTVMRETRAILRQNVRQNLIPRPLPILGRGDFIEATRAATVFLKYIDGTGHTAEGGTGYLQLSMSEQAQELIIRALHECLWVTQWAPYTGSGRTGRFSGTWL